MAINELIENNAQKMTDFLTNFSEVTTIAGAHARIYRVDFYLKLTKNYVRFFTPNRNLFTSIEPGSSYMMEETGSTEANYLLSANELTVGKLSH